MAPGPSCAGCDRRDVEGVIEVRVPEHDGVGPRHVTGDRFEVRAERPRHAGGERGAGYVRVQKQDVAAVLDHEASRAEPTHPHVARGSVASERVCAPSEVFRAHDRHPFVGPTEDEVIL
jgi:hypothetical protein